MFRPGHRCQCWFCLFCQVKTARHRLWMDRLVRVHWRVVFWSGLTTSVRRTLRERIEQFSSALAFMLVLCGGGLKAVSIPSCAIFAAGMRGSMPDIGAGARVGARMLVLEQLTLIWRHLELEPVTEVFCTVCRN